MCVCDALTLFLGGRHKEAARARKQIAEGGEREGNLGGIVEREREREPDV